MSRALDALGMEILIVEQPCGYWGLEPGHLKSSQCSELPSHLSSPDHIFCITYYSIQMCTLTGSRDLEKRAIKGIVGHLRHQHVDSS